MWALSGSKLLWKGNSMKWLNAIFERTVDVLGFSAAVLIAVVMLGVTLEICLRYFTPYSMVWIIELTQYGLVFITFLGATWVLKRDKHTSIDIVLNQLSPRPRNVVNVIISILGAIVCLIVTAYGTKVVLDYMQMSYFYPHASLWIPAHLLAAVIPLSGFLLFIQFLKRGYRYLGNLRALQ